jgi:hypothetical protein
VSDLLFFEQVIPRDDFKGFRDTTNSKFLGGSRPLFLRDYVLIPASDVQFRRGQKMTVFFEVYNPGITKGAEGPSLKIQCRFWRGDVPVGRLSEKQLDHVTEQSTAASVPRTVYGLSIPLQSFDPGEYSFEVEVFDQVLDQTVSSRTPFTVF